MVRELCIVVLVIGVDLFDGLNMLCYCFMDQEWKFYYNCFNKLGGLESFSVGCFFDVVVVFILGINCQDYEGEVVMLL